MIDRRYMGIIDYRSVVNLKMNIQVGRTHEKYTDSAQHEHGLIVHTWQLEFSPQSCANTEYRKS